MENGIINNISLQQYNTFGVAATAQQFIEITNESELTTLYREGWFKKPFFVLGGGSNVLFTQDYSGLIVRINLQGLSQVEREKNEIHVTAGAGTVWNDLVWYCVDQELAGIENLALIPGSVGAAPIQNIGAYGVELMDVFFSCRAFDTQTGEVITLYHEDCRFSYRDSIFKQAYKGRYIIIEVTLRLSKIPNINTSYGAINQELARRGILTPTIRDIAEVVSAIRVEKLPDPSTIGNSGSFFKNPLISKAQFSTLQQRFPAIVFYPAPNDLVKIAAGWLIEQCEWKGKRVGHTGTWKHQALVLVNHQNATGMEIFQLSEQIIADVFERFEILLEREVNII